MHDQHSEGEAHSHSEHAHHHHAEERHEEFIIFVNTRERRTHHREITYDYVVKLAFPDAKLGDGESYTVTYTSPGHGPSGVLPPGGKVKTEQDMNFVVAPSNRS